MYAILYRYHFGKETIFRLGIADCKFIKRIIKADLNNKKGFPYVLISDVCIGNSPLVARLP